MLEAYPPRSPGVPAGYTFIAVILFLDAILLYLLFNRPVSLLSFFLGLVAFLSLPAVAFLAYWTAALSRARYLLTGDSLQIEWGPFLHAVPMACIRSVDNVAAGSRLYDFNGLRWPGYLLGRGRLISNPANEASQLGPPPAYFFATQAPGDALLVHTNGNVYGLSPQDPDTFRNALQAAMVAAQPPAIKDDGSTRNGGWTEWPIWQDRTARTLLILPLLVNGALFALLAALFPRLPLLVPLRMDGAGAILLSGPAIRLFLPPLFALLTWLFNAAAGWYFYHYRREQSVAYLLWAAAVVIEFAAWPTLLLLLP